MPDQPAGSVPRHDARCRLRRSARKACGRAGHGTSTPPQPSSQPAIVCAGRDALGESGSRNGLIAAGATASTGARATHRALLARKAPQYWVARRGSTTAQCRQRTINSYAASSFRNHSAAAAKLLASTVGRAVAILSGVSEDSRCHFSRLRRHQRRMSYRIQSAAPAIL